MAMQRKTRWRVFVATFVVALGIAVVWGVLGGWIASFVEDSRPEVTETINVAADGAPVICVQSDTSSGTISLSRRTLDGKSWPVEYEYWLNNGFLQPREQPGGVVQIPIRWANRGRIGGISDTKRPPTDWYIVRDDEPVGHCYLAGYDAMSKLPVGFIGRKGFRETKPAIEEQFALPATYEGLYSYVATNGYLDWWRVIPYDYVTVNDVEPQAWLLYVLEGDKLWEVDLRHRLSRVVLESPGSVSVSLINALKSTVDAATTPTAGSANQSQKSLFRTVADSRYSAVFVPQADTGEKSERPKFSYLLSVRTDEELILYDPVAAKKWEFKLPKDLPQKGFSVNWISPQQLLIVFSTGYWSGGYVDKLVWIDASGKITKEEEVQLASRRPENPRAAAWGYAGIAPVAIEWLLGLTIVAPLGLLQDHAASTFGDAIHQSFDIGWPPFVAVIAVAAILAWITVRLQRRYRRFATPAWATFVLLLGVPGFIAYWLEQRMPKLEPCAECGEIVPRDRDACAACSAQFAPPPRVGTEIFA